MLAEITIEAPAKINLTLDVKGKRADGYHELETVMHQIDLVDKIIMRPCSQGITIESNSYEIPDGEENLAYKAASLMLRQFPQGRGIYIYIQKNIPIGAGLAGGSTDAAAVIKGVNLLYGLQLGQPALLQWGEAIGSDVPFCISGGTALARGRGEILEPLAAAVKLEMVLVKPEFQLSTAEVYRDLRLEQDCIHPSTSAFLEAWTKCDIINIACHLGNILESVSLKKIPLIGMIKKEMLDLGALGTVMSGSGPTVVGVFADRRQAQKASEFFKTRYQEVYLVSSYDRGDEDGEKPFIAR